MSDTSDEKVQDITAEETEEDEVEAEYIDSPDDDAVANSLVEEEEKDEEEEEVHIYPASDEDGLYEYAYEVINSALDQENVTSPGQDDDLEMEIDSQQEANDSNTEDTEKESPSDVGQPVECRIYPSKQVFTMLMEVHWTIKQVKEVLSDRLKVAKEAINILCQGPPLSDTTTLQEINVTENEAIKLTVLVGGLRESVDRVDDPRPSQITVSVEKAEKGKRKIVTVDILRRVIKKPFLGGYRHRVSGTEYHNASAQTDPDPLPPVTIDKRCRDTQTVIGFSKKTQTTSTTSTQMPRSDYHISPNSDKTLVAGDYFTADEYLARREKAAILLQSHFRRLHAGMICEQLREDEKQRILWLRIEEIERQKKKEERIRRSLEIRLNPRSKEDFNLVYSALEKWRCEEEKMIKSEGAGIPETKADLYYLLLQHTQHIATIDQKRLEIALKAKEFKRWEFLSQAAKPKKWLTYNGRFTYVETLKTRHASRLMELYNSATSDYLALDERLEVLIAIKLTVQVHDCRLVRELIGLVEREALFIMRGVPTARLTGLRKRIATYLFLYCKNPVFNPEAGRLLMVRKPQSNDMYRCTATQRCLPSGDFYIKATSKSVKRCKKAIDLQNTAYVRHDLHHYSNLLNDLKHKEESYKDDSKVIHLMQKGDLQHLVENIWLGQSIFSGSNDIFDLIPVRWDKYEEWSPWNCILLTHNEARTHLSLDHVEEFRRNSLLKNHMTTYRPPCLYECSITCTNQKRSIKWEKGKEAASFVERKH